MAREFMDFVKGEIETPFGLMRYAITEGEHVSISAGGSGDPPPITVNRVPYYTHVHLFLRPEGGWAKRTYSDMSMTRAGSPGDSASRAAAEKAYDGVRAAWEGFISSNQGLLVEAERGHLNNQIQRVEEKAEEARAELAALEAEYNALLGREAALG